MAIISNPLVTRILKHAQDSKLFITWTLKHGYNFKIPCTCYKFIFIMFSFYLIMIYIEHAPYDYEQVTNQCKVYCFMS
jgi:hypothetical protein